jgi:uncharacterized protein involved in exopolysaccharide biosynthesis
MGNKMPHKHVEAMLPSDFASRFFKHAPKRAKAAAKEPTAAELDALIAERQEELALLQKQRDDVRAKEGAAAEAQRKLEEDRVELERARKEAEAAAARVAALEAKVNGK